jgi:hypothetical protein
MLFAISTPNPEFFRSLFRPGPSHSLRKNSTEASFVTGHDFGRANKPNKMSGL